MAEILPIVDCTGEVLGCATRTECHGGAMLLHPVVHLHVMRRGGWLYLQKRAASKDIQPGKWDTAVGGHVDYGEDVTAALLREAREELSLTGIEPIKMQPYIFQSECERELINPYYVYIDEGCMPVTDPDEIEDGRFWHRDEIENALGKEIFTPNFEAEFQKIKIYLT